MIRYVALAVLTALLASCGTARRGIPVAGPMLIESEKVELGQRVFMANCNSCHPRGEAGVGPSINDKPLPGFLIKFQVRHGLGAMPAFGEDEISEQELEAIVAYLEYLSSREPVRGIPD